MREAQVVDYEQSAALSFFVVRYDYVRLNFHLTKKK